MLDDQQHKTWEFMGERKLCATWRWPRTWRSATFPLACWSSKTKQCQSSTVCSNGCATIMFFVHYAGQAFERCNRQQTDQLLADQQLMWDDANAQVSSSGKCSLKFIAPKVSSSIPDDIKFSTTFTFKWKLKKHLLYEKNFQLWTLATFPLSRTTYCVF